LVENDEMRIQRRAVDENDCWESQRLYFGIQTMDLIPKYILKIPLLNPTTRENLIPLPFVARPIQRIKLFEHVLVRLYASNF
jgi:hypothetical protein